MIIVNETTFKTDDFRKLVKRAVEVEGIDTLQRVRVQWIKGRFIRGTAPYGGVWVRMFIPHRLKQGNFTPERVKEFAQVFVHELGHLRGLLHSAMRKWWDLEVEWAEGLQIRCKVEKPKQKVDLIEKRGANARAKLREHERKLARQQKLVRKWRQKVRYYEKKLSERAAASPRGVSIIGGCDVND
jgi:hypothetical protein